MPANQAVGYNNIAMILNPADIGATDTTSVYVNLKTAQWLSFLVSFGAITTATSTDTAVVTVECATAEGGSEAAVAFRYRLSGVTATDTGSWAAASATADTTGVTIASTDDNKILWIDVDPADLASSDYVVARVKIATPADMTALLCAAHAIITPRYKQTTFVSSTASASS